MTTAATEKLNRLEINKVEGKMIADYWEDVFTARVWNDSRVTVLQTRDAAAAQSRFRRVSSSASG